MKTDKTAEVGMHVFERAGLGKAPFRCVGFSEMVFNVGDGTTKAGGSCNYCYTGIRWACHILSADGKRFHVGTDCVAKTGDTGLIKSYRTRPEVRAINRAKAAAKANAVMAEWDRLMADPANRAKLAAMPAPNKFSENMLVALEWVWPRCGASGKARYLKALKTTLGKE